MAHGDGPLGPPSLGLLALEGRAWFELGALLPALPLLERAPAGDGHPVLVLPGWLASDRSTQALRWFLRRRGYRVHGWQLGRNNGPTPDTVSGLGRRFSTLQSRYDRKISLVGWSLGGIYARELARRFPDDVRQVITLASPFRDPSASNAARLFRSLQLQTSRYDPAVRDRLRTPPPVPTSALYSRSDGIVAWQSCVDETGPLHENIELVSSHIGMGHHPLALFVIADRLAQPQDQWRPFRFPNWTAWMRSAVRANG